MPDKPVDLDGQTGYVLPDDLEDTEPGERWAALLPALDPTTMGWYERDWYVGHRKLLFDGSGNAGATVVGRSDRRRLASDQARETSSSSCDDVDADARGAIELEAARLTEWFVGVRVLPRFPSPLSKAAAAR